MFARIKIDLTFSMKKYHLICRYICLHKSITFFFLKLFHMQMNIIIKGQINKTKNRETKKIKKIK